MIRRFLAWLGISRPLPRRAVLEATPPPRGEGDPRAIAIRNHRKARS